MSYNFISMNAMHVHPKLRIKIPESLVVRKMQRKKFHLHNIKDNATTGPSDRDKGSTMANRGTGVLGDKRSLGNGMCSFKGKKNEPQGDSGEGKECHFTEELGNNLVCEDEAVVPANALSKLLTLEESLEHDGTAASEGKQNRKDKKPVKMSLPFLSFLEKKKKRWNNFKAKIRRSSDGTSLSQVRRKVNSWRLVQIPSKLLVIRLKLKMVRSLMKRKVTKQPKQDLEQEGDENGDELCKKRILMGVRCKPLSSSGTLRYDEDGLFLPEISSLTSTPCHLP